MRQAVLAVDRAWLPMLRQAGVENPAGDLRRLCRWAEAAGRGPQALARAVRRRAAREPLSRIVGRRDFWNFSFRIDRHVLDPRPESETLVAGALDALPAARRGQALRVLDLGVGSGCLLLSLLAELPRATGVGVDTSAAALAAARRNAEAFGLAGRCAWVCGNWADAVDGRFDVVLCNPPYVRTADIRDLQPEVRDAEPRLALDGGPDGLDAYRRLAPALPGVLAPGGTLCLEIGAEQAVAVGQLLRQAGFSRLAFAEDLDGRDRCVILRGGDAGSGGRQGRGRCSPAWRA